ncbi:MAG: 50S ribosomal protein L32 [Pseudonocardiaceae bacterium]|nr:50S ribosomal protein L32 [Pseudonocardiaceae bacterium]
MAVPKRQMSRSNTRTRRAAWMAKARVPDLVPITVDGERKLVPRKLVRHYQRGL